jgi:hypothetical protein
MRPSRVLGPLLLALFATPAALGQPAPPAAPAAPLQLRISSGVRGDLTRLACAAPGARAQGFSAAARSLARPATGATLRLDAGDLFAATATSHIAVREHLPALVEAVAATGLRALALGHRDLAASRDDLTARSAALAARGVHSVLSNLRCEGAAESLCAAVRDAGDAPLVLDTEAGGVGVVALLAPGNLASIARDRAEGLTLEPAALSLGRATLAARAAGARYVVAFYDPVASASLTDALGMARSLPREERPDVIFVQDLSGDLATVEVERGAALRVFATEAGEVLETSLPSPETPRVLAPDGDAPPAVTALADRVGESLCVIARDPLPGGTLTQPLDRAAMTTLLLDVMREATESEVAVINRGAVRPLATFPLRERVSRVDVMAAMPFDDTVRVARMKGETLAAFMRDARSSHFAVRGVEADGEGFTVNGRPLVPEQMYRVVTTGFVADGGDGGFGEEEIRFEIVGHEGPRDLLLRWLSTPREGDITTAPVDPARRTRWTFRAVIDASWSETSIANTANYQDPQLVRSQGTAIQVDGEVHIDAEQPRYTFENLLRLRLGYQRTIEGTDDTGLLKVADLIALRDQFAWRGVWRTRRWFHPVPYVESYLESEFSPPDPSLLARDFHHLQWRPTGGVRFELPRSASINFGAGVDWETLEPGARPLAVGVARAELPPTTLFTIQDRAIEGQLYTEVAWREPWSDDHQALVRLNARLSVPVIEPLALTVSYDLFARQRASDPWSVAHDINLGVRLDLVRTLQLFSY